MPERGGPTTQSGIFYQNSVAAIYLGQLLDKASWPETERIAEVRVEAPEHVDDTVISFDNGQVVFIQAKEDIKINDPAWAKLWCDFHAQYCDEKFIRGRDRLVLHVGTPRYEHLQEACERAISSRDFVEWQSRLTNQQRSLIDSVRRLLDIRLADEAQLLEFFRHLQVDIWTQAFIERDLLRFRIPSSNVAQKTLFSLLRDRVGGEARIRGIFTATNLSEQLRRDNDLVLVAAWAINDLRLAVAACGDVLRQHKATIGGTGRHLDRPVVDRIIEWVQKGEDSDRVAVLLDQAGMGKTVVLRDVMQRLEGDGTTVLAIKADLQLSGVTSHDDIQRQLRLPEPLERIVLRLAQLGRIVILIDQLDALSLSMARDERALTLALELIARLRQIPGVKLLASSRTFDWKSDPRLRNMEVATEFPLTELADDDVQTVLESVQVDPDTLTPATRMLLRVPLHLDLFVRAMESQPLIQRMARGIQSLQDLYALLWQMVVLKTDPSGPSVSERVEVISIMTERMNRDQQTVVPQAIFTAPETARLQPALAWLASAGIIIPGVGEWGFLHQTFFDYCYAWQFVENRGELAATLLRKDQGFAARPHLVHVLAYLRGTNHRAYVRELSNLLNADILRYHLRDLALRFFGAVASPTDEEWFLARRLLADPVQRPKLLSAMYSQAGWWTRIKQDHLPSMLTGDDTIIDVEALPYLASLINVVQKDVATILSTYLGRNDRWNARIAWVMLRVSRWQAREALDLFENLFHHQQASRQLLYELHDVAVVSPAHACRVIGLVLDQLLDQYIEKLNTWDSQPRDELRSIFLRPSLCTELEVLNGSVFVQAVTVVSEAEPQLFLDLMVPWLKRVLDLTPERDDPYYFATDNLSHGWHDHVYVIQLSLVHALTRALTTLGHQEPDAFRRITRALAELPYETPQQLLAQAYAAMPEQFAKDALAFLLEDQRRLTLGDHEQYESRRLISAIYSFLSRREQIDLESCLLGYMPVRSYLGVKGLRWSRLEQLYLLQAVPEQLLSTHGVRRLRELERKFPGAVASEKPIGMVSGFVGSPISINTACHMSDRDWLFAMQHYQGTVRHKDYLKGGAHELSGVLVTLIKGDPQQNIQGDPERFYRLLSRVPDTVDDAYVQAYLNGFAEAAAPAEWLFTIVRRFAGQVGRDIRLTVAWALRKRVHDGLPDDLLDLLEQQVRSPIGEDEALHDDGSRDPYNRYLNSDRGAAFLTLMRALDQYGTPETKERKWNLIEFATTDPSTPLRAGAIEELLYLLASDEERAVVLFERLMEGYLALMQSHFAPEFVYHALYRHFARMRPFIIAMMNSEEEAVQQRGAELACIAYISLNPRKAVQIQTEAQTLADRAAQGAVPWRRGAARIYAYNLVGSACEQCEHGLCALLDDNDETVRREASNAIRMLRGEHFLPLRKFLEQYAASQTAQAEMREFADYLLEHGLLDPEWTLSIVTMLLDNIGKTSEMSGLGGSESLIRLIVRIYNDPTSDDEMRLHSMNLFDSLMEQFSSSARQVLAEWDRR